MNLHPRHEHYDSDESGQKMPRVNVKSGVSYWVCFGTRDIVFCKSHDVKMVHVAATVFNTGGKENGGVVGNDVSNSSGLPDFGPGWKWNRYPSPHYQLAWNPTRSVLAELLLRPDKNTR